MLSRRVKGCKDYLLEGLQRRYISLSVYRSLHVLLNIDRGLRNQGRANLLTAISRRPVYIGHRADYCYKNSKACNYYCAYISSTRL